MSDQSLHYGNVCFTPDGIVELAGERASLFIPRAEMRSIELAHGAAAERPVAQSVLALILLGTGLYLLMTVLIRIHQVISLRWGVISLRWGVISLFLSGIGAWLLRTVSRKRTYLSIETGKGRRKIIFDRVIDMIELQDFLERAGREHGYVVTSSLPGVGGT